LPKLICRKKCQNHKNNNNNNNSIITSLWQSCNNLFMPFFIPHFRNVIDQIDSIKFLPHHYSNPKNCSLVLFLLICLLLISSRTIKLLYTPSCSAWRRKLFSHQHSSWLASILFTHSMFIGKFVFLFFGFFFAVGKL
jgi:hypothetical protein